MRPRFLVGVEKVVLLWDFDPETILFRVKPNRRQLSQRDVYSIGLLYVYRCMYIIDGEAVT